MPSIVLCSLLPESEIASDLNRTMPRTIVYYIMKLRITKVSYPDQIFLATNV
ncbi:Protein of unknown function [Pyronema omphalodes CBS 100304]|uniref:Uncharacterized protein n=1 Tax=Pyronema omphalodes (strain CBS 100304) TaxID=1076935 RepID=U4LNX8_PYROM|nr:Protein of unknown function [Pyronema omphalodes CBS 100304]